MFVPLNPNSSVDEIDFILEDCRPTVLVYERALEEKAERVVEQGKIITAAGVSSGIDMALLLCARIAGEDVAKAIQLSVEYDPQPPFDAGSPEKAGKKILETVRKARQRLLEERQKR